MASVRTRRRRWHAASERAKRGRQYAARSRPSTRRRYTGLGPSLGRRRVVDGAVRRRVHGAVRRRIVDDVVGQAHDAGDPVRVDRRARGSLDADVDGEPRGADALDAVARDPGRRVEDADDDAAEARGD